MRKKWMFIVIALLVIVGIGGKVFMDKQEDRKEAEIIEVERMSVVAINGSEELNKKY